MGINVNYSYKNYMVVDSIDYPHPHSVGSSTGYDADQVREGGREGKKERGELVCMCFCFHNYPTILRPRNLLFY